MLRLLFAQVSTLLLPLQLPFSCVCGSFRDFTDW